MNEPTFLSEWGALLDNQENILHLVPGTGSVQFPAETMWELHKQSPGKIYCMAHSHPPGFLGLSDEDKSTLKAWIYALYPFPIRMSVITLTDGGFSEVVVLGMLESKETWMQQDPRPSKREVIFIEEEVRNFNNQGLRPYQAVLIQKSYKLFR